MPARIVVVLNDPELAQDTVESLATDGLHALAIHDPMKALDMLGYAEDIELLVASSYFGEKKPTGAALALITRKRRPNLKVIFAATDREVAPLLEDIGRVLVDPITSLVISEAVRTAIAI